MPIYVDPAIVGPSLPEVLHSPDGILFAVRRDNGVLLKAVFPEPHPHKVRFIRTDTTHDTVELVRSGHDAYAPGGVAYAFDGEAAADTVVTYTATPIDRDGTQGATSAGVGIATPDIPEGKDSLIKSVDDPTLSMALTRYLDLQATGTRARLQLSDVPGSRYQAGTYDLRIQSERTYTFKTATIQEYNDLEALLDSGPLLVQQRAKFGESDLFCLAGDSSWTYAYGTYSEARRVTVPFHPIQRPPTEGAPMAGAGRSYDWLAGQVTEYEQIWVIFGTYTGIPESGGPPLEVTP